MQKIKIFDFYFIIYEPIIYKYDFCIKTYIYQLKTGNSWRQLEEYKNKKLDAVRKKINK